MSERRARRAAGASTLPLLGLAIAFFLPAQKTCGSVDVPVELFTRDLRSMAFLYPYFLATIFAVLVGVALWRGLSRKVELTTVVLAILAASVALIFGCAMTVDALAHGHHLEVELFAALALGANALALGVAAARTKGWPRVVRSLSSLASALLASPLSYELFGTWRDSLHPLSTQPPELLEGGRLFFAMAITLAILAAVGMIPERAPAQQPDVAEPPA